MYSDSNIKNLLLREKYLDYPNLNRKSKNEIRNLFHQRQKNIFKRDYITPDKELAKTIQNERFRNVIEKAMKRLAKMEDNRYLNDPIIKKILVEWNTLNNSIVEKIENRITQINTLPTTTVNSPSSTEQMMQNIQKLSSGNRGPSTPVAHKGVLNKVPTYLNNVPPVPPPIHRGVLKSKFSSDGQLIWYWDESANNSPLLLNPVVSNLKKNSKNSKNSNNFHTHGPPNTPYTPSSSGTIETSYSPQFKTKIYRTNIVKSTNSARTANSETNSQTAARKLFE
jgi:hypothetical protein